MNSCGEVQTKDRWLLLAVSVLGVYVVLVPSISLIPSLGLYNEKRVLQIGVLFVVGGILLVSSTVRKRWLTVFSLVPGLPRWGLGVVLGLGVFSSLLAPAPVYAFLELGHFVLLFVAAGIVASAVRNLTVVTERIFLGAVVTSVLLYTVYFVVSYGVSLALPALEIGRETVSGFANVRFLNQYQTWTLPLLAVPIIIFPRRSWTLRGLVFCLLALWWTLLFASVVRGAFLALFIAFPVVGLLFGRRAGRLIAVQGAALLVGLGIYYLLFTTGVEGVPAVIGKVDNTRSYVGRLEHWQICLEMVAAHPLLGGGPMHYAWPPFNFMPAAHPHNAFMQWLGEWGIPSTAIMSGFTVWGGWKWIQQEKAGMTGGNSDSDALRIGLIASALAGSAYAMISGVLVMPMSQILLVMIGGWAWGRYSYVDEPFDNGLPTMRAQTILCVILVASMVVVGASFQDLTTTEERRSAFSEAVDRRYFSPRYWTQGYIGVRDSSVIERARRDR